MILFTVSGGWGRGVTGSVKVESQRSSKQGRASGGATCDWQISTSLVWFHKTKVDTMTGLHLGPAHLWCHASFRTNTKPGVRAVIRSIWTAVLLPEAEGFRLSSDHSRTH